MHGKNRGVVIMIDSVSYLTLLAKSAEMSCGGKR
jgi:hypothetical protein